MHHVLYEVITVIYISRQKWQIADGPGKITRLAKQTLKHASGFIRAESDPQIIVGFGAVEKSN